MDLASPAVSGTSVYANALVQLKAPDDGRGGARNMLSDTKRQVINS